LVGWFAIIGAIRHDGVDGSRRLIQQRADLPGIALAAVRRQLWEDGLFQTSGQSRDMVKIPAPLAQRLLDAASFPA
jgi:hypothetical protein